MNIYSPIYICCVLKSKDKWKLKCTPHKSDINGGSRATTTKSFKLAFSNTI